MPDRNGRKVVSIVGARRSTSYGEDIAYRLAYKLAKRGAIIVSGMAYGIDAASHRGCLDAGGVTVAVLGTAIDKIYPHTNLALSRQILQNGVILSEYPPGEITRSYHFLERNRIVSALADALIVVEASARSGTAYTVQSALMQNKDVYVVPGDITRPMSEGCNRWIYDGASPIVNVDEFVRDFATSNYSDSSSENDCYADMSNEAKSIIQALKSGTRTSAELLSELRINDIVFRQQISLLELRGIIKSCDFDSWSLL